MQNDDYDNSMLFVLFVILNKSRTLELNCLLKIKLNNNKFYFCHTQSRTKFITLLMGHTYRQTHTHTQTSDSLLHLLYGGMDAVGVSCSFHDFHCTRIIMGTSTTKIINYLSRHKLKIFTYDTLGGVHSREFNTFSY